MRRSTVSWRLIGRRSGRAIDDDPIESLLYEIQPQTKLTERTEIVDINLVTPAVWSWLGIGPQRQVILPGKARTVYHGPVEGLPRNAT